VLLLLHLYLYLEGCRQGCRSCGNEGQGGRVEKKREKRRIRREGEDISKRTACVAAPLCLWALALASTFSPVCVCVYGGRWDLSQGTEKEEGATKKRRNE
jgi:hypothetical protein